MTSAFALLVITVIVSVTDAKVIPILVEGFSSPAMEGTTITWTCVDPSGQATKFSWYKGATMLSSSGDKNELFTKTVEKTDEGTYYCAISQGASIDHAEMSDEMTFKVTAAPPNVPTISGFTASITAGTTFSWTCVATGSIPVTSFEWWKDGVAAKLTGTTGSKGETYSKVATTEDQGTYKCKAVNSEGPRNSAPQSLTVTDSSGGGGSSGVGSFGGGSSQKAIVMYIIVLLSVLLSQ